MVRRHEIPQSASGPDAHEQALIRTLEQNGPVNGTQLTIFESGVNPDQPQYPISSKPSRRTYRGGGKGRAQPRDIDFDPDASATVPLPGDAEQAHLETDSRAPLGPEATRRIGAILAHDEVMKATADVPARDQIVTEFARLWRREHGSNFDPHRRRR